MRPLTSTTTSLPLLFASLASALTLNCEHIRVDAKKFDLHKLGGPHSVLVHDESRPPALHNITWTVDICKPLRKVKDKNIPNADQCPTGTHVCGIDTSYNPNDTPIVPVVDRVIPVAGNFHVDSGRPLDPKYTRLKASDANKEGLQIELNGGYYAEKKQRAIIEFQCDKDRTGNEGAEGEDDKKKREDKKDDGKETPNSLTYVSYGAVDEKLDVLRLNWRTKYACEDHVDDEDDGKRGGWGFFTWFILMYVFHSDFHTADMLTNPQCIPRNSNLPNLRLMAELQPLRRARLGPPPPRRHNP
jgi:autophagy-related protein 27